MRPLALLHVRARLRNNRLRRRLLIRRRRCGRVRHQKKDPLWVHSRRRRYERDG
jgi:hypothetical protein